jgi:NADH-quinone oxidoreductase subunit A
VLGWLVRPRLPNVEKLEVYECGEPTIGSSFVQFDLRFYVVALLFIIFDVEVAFFFPWAVVFGKATQLSAEPPAAKASALATTRLEELGLTDAVAVKSAQAGNLAGSAGQLAKMSIVDILVFFFVLMVGFFYVWKRGDLDWVRTVARDRVRPLHRPPPPRAVEPSQSILSA